MREIKFRAWHKEEKLICQLATITFGSGAFLVGVKPGENIYDDEVLITPDDGRFCKFDEFELMQYTGLKDKNGIEIYEGDIVKEIISFPDFHREERYKIEYKGESFGCTCKGGGRYSIQFKELEVIGNIHENPELFNN